MIEDRAEKRFDQLWEFFTKHRLSMAGSMFTVEPLRKYFPIAFADSLTEDSSRSRFHAELDAWGKRELAYKDPQTRTETLADGTLVTLPDFTDSVGWDSRFFILDSFYNLCCLGVHQRTIEELVYEANHHRYTECPSAPATSAFFKLIGISKSFLLAEWTQDIFHRAIVNEDERFFKKLRLCLDKNTTVERFATARSWLGTTMLWYLGGKDILPRKQYMWILREKGIIPISMQMESFKAMLSNLGLTKDLSVTK